MGRIRSVPPVKLFCGLLSGDDDLLRRTRQLLERRFGAVELPSETWDFTQTHYYDEEMGPELRRQFLAFERLMHPADLAEIKIETNALEQRLADDIADDACARPVNIDPGYLDPGKLVLATTKDRAHRICIGRGIFAEVTLQYVAGQWRASEWTYADYQTPHYQAYFTQVRERLMRQRSAAEAAANGGAPQ